MTQGEFEPACIWSKTITSISSATCDTKGKLQLCLLALIPVYQGLNSSYYVTEYRVNFLKSSKHCVTLELCSAIKELIFGWLWKSHEHYKHWRVAAALFDCLKLRWSKLRPLRCHCLKICFWLPCLTVNESNQRYVSVCDTVAMFEFKNFEVYESQQMWLFLSSVTSLPCRRNYKPRYRSLVSSATLDIGYIPCIYVTFEFIEALWRFSFPFARQTMYENGHETCPIECVHCHAIKSKIIAWFQTVQD